MAFDAAGESALERHPRVARHIRTPHCAIRPRSRDIPATHQGGRGEATADALGGLRMPHPFSPCLRLQCPPARRFPRSPGREFRAGCPDR